MVEAAKETRDRRFTFRMTESEYTELQRQAEAKNMSVADFIIYRTIRQRAPVRNVRRKA